MPRFFVSDLGEAEKTISIVGEDARHIALSLRMACGDFLTLSDGRGRDYSCRLTSITPDRVVAEVLSSAPSATESPVCITLYQAFPKGDKLDTIVQKAVELGASSIVPFSSQFCVRRPTEERSARQGARLSRIAEEAAKQTGRGVIPTLGAKLSFEDMLVSAARSELALFCYEAEGTRPLPACLPEKMPQTISVVIGSEGGFSLEEAKRAQDAGLTLCGLGSRILRCETASAYVLSALSFVYELS